MGKVNFRLKYPSTILLEALLVFVNTKPWCVWVTPTVRDHEATDILEGNRKEVLHGLKNKNVWLNR